MTFEEVAIDAGMMLQPFRSPDLTKGITVPSFVTDRLDQGLKILFYQGVDWKYTKDVCGFRFYKVLK